MMVIKRVPVCCVLVWEMLTKQVLVGQGALQEVTRPPGRAVIGVSHRYCPWGMSGSSTCSSTSLSQGLQRVLAIPSSPGQEPPPNSHSHRL